MPGARQACRTALVGRSAGGSHAGVVLDYFLQKTCDDGASKRDLLARAVEACQRARPLYEKAFHRQYAALPLRKTLEVKGRLITGLGSQTVLETGITLHHTYGTPILPGSGLKGLAAHYCSEVWGIGRPEFQDTGDCYQCIFGTMDDAAYVVFHDAWITPRSLQGDNGLVLDVMTPHHSDYYMGDQSPTDFDDPIPVAFLSMAGQFELAISCGNTAGAEEKKWAELAMQLMIQAVEDWGAGGKTNSGYGRLRAV